MSFRWTSEPPGGAAGVIERRLARAHAAALEDVAAVARRAAPRRTGEYAASIEASTDGLTGRVGSSLDRASALERGANVGRRRGPHMQGQPTVRPAVIQTYGEALQRRMSEGSE